MPAVPQWDGLLRGGVLRALSQGGAGAAERYRIEGGGARLHITAGAVDGRLVRQPPQSGPQTQAGPHHPCLRDPHPQPRR